MPYYKRGSLTDRIQNDPVSLSEVIRIGQGVLSGLAMIHARGLLHLDVKPSNVLFSDRDVPLVADFGQAQQLDETGTAPHPGNMYGPGMPPEMVLKKEPRIQADIYQAGVTLYRGVNGDPMFDRQVTTLFGRGNIDAIKNAILSGRFPDRSAFLPHVPKAMRTALRKAMNVDLTRRFATATEFAKALAKLSFRNDWTVGSKDDGEVVWRAIRRGQPELLVTMVESNGKWAAKIYTQRAGAAPRAWKTSAWIEPTSRKDCMDHLVVLFANLEQV
jgi:serine/threonine protein kinase